MNVPTSPSSSSVNTPSTNSSFSLPLNPLSLQNDIDPIQTQNLDTFLTFLDDRKTFLELTRLIDGKTAFQRLLTLDHIHGTIRHMERELRRQKNKATILLDQLIKEKSSKRLRHYLRNSDHPGPDYHTRKYTPPHSSPSTSNSSSRRKRSEPVPSPEPIPIPPPQSTAGTWKYPIVISDD